MQTINLNINTEVTAFGNLPVPTSIITAHITSVEFQESTTFCYQASCYVSQTEIDNNEPIMIKGLNQVGLQGISFNFGGRIAAEDFTLATDGLCCLTTASLDSFKDTLKTMIATELGIDETDIS